MVWKKICGITNYDDAKLAVSLGTDAVGYIFAESKRKADRDLVKRINMRLPPKIEKIGVFVDEKEDVVHETAEYCCLTGLQFHGNESVEYCKRFDRYKVIKSFLVNKELGWDNISSYGEKAIDYFLFDTYISGQQGGTGKAFPWSILEGKSWSKPVIIAGGINSNNVLKVSALENVFGIDVCSGVEASPGKKDREKLIRLFQYIK